MSAITLYTDASLTEQVESITLAEVLAPETFNDALYGEPVHLFAKNTSGGGIRDLRIGASGEYADNAQVGLDVGGEPMWSEPGEFALVSTETVFADQEFSFWIRAIYNPTDAEGPKSLSVSIKGIAIGTAS